MSDPLAQWRAAYPEAAAALDALSLPDMPVTGGEGSEARAQSLIRLEAPRHGATLWRNNVGVFVDETGRHVRVGLANDTPALNKTLKSSDLIGIAPEGKFLAIEVKHPGWTQPANAREKAQMAFLNLVNSRGGIGAFCTDPSQLPRILGVR